MNARLNPYLSFRDNARAAMTFYQEVFGGDLDISTFAEYHASEDPAEANKVMHGKLESPSGLVLMGADTPNSMELTAGNNYAVSVSGDDESELRGYWDKLSANGTVVMPLEKAPWGDWFGMCTDSYGTSWMINIAGTSE